MERGDQDPPKEAGSSAAFRTPRNTVKLSCWPSGPNLLFQPRFLAPLLSLLSGHTTINSQVPEHLDFLAFVLVIASACKSLSCEHPIFLLHPVRLLRHRISHSLLHTHLYHTVRQLFISKSPPTQFCDGPDSILFISACSGHDRKQVAFGECVLDNRLTE